MRTPLMKNKLVFCMNCEGQHDESWHEHYTHTSYCAFPGCGCQKFVPATKLRKVLKKLGIVALVVFIVLVTTVQI